MESAQRLGAVGGPPWDRGVRNVLEAINYCTAARSSRQLPPRLSVSQGGPPTTPSLFADSTHDVPSTVRS